MRTLQRPAHRSQTDVARARSWALVTGAGSGHDRADLVLIDLEDGTPPEEKAALRRRVRASLEDGSPCWVRVNPVSTEEWQRDVEELAQQVTLQGVMLAKVESAIEVHRTVEAFAGRPVVALIESARGVEAAFEIASVPGVARLAFGIGDYRRDTGVGDDAAALSFPRSRLAVASRAAGLPGPVDGPTLSADRADLNAAIRAAANVGMRGKLVLDPAQIEHVNQVFRPTAEAVAQARRVLAGAAVGDGSLLPRLAIAEQTLRDEQYYAQIDDSRGEESSR